jgi:spore cortex formation protein SpoVR/YcgB (stage V sporulation)
MWAMLLAVEKKHPDFLESKTAIEKNERNSKKPKLKISPEAEARAAEYKEKQAQFKKQQYEKQKAWAKEKRRQKKEKHHEGKESQSREKYSAPVEQALEFFTKNGFKMEDLPTLEVLKLARKNLSRVFHPDKGGTHDETVVLNHHCEILSRFIAMINK